MESAHAEETTMIGSDRQWDGEETTILLARARDGESPSELPAQRRLLGELSDCAEQALAGHQRLVWRMRHDEGRDYADIAGRLGMAEAAVRRQYARACERLTRCGLIGGSPGAASG
jgi:DNA-directed RNA polymerase specialized sigma24 family protein